MSTQILKTAPYAAGGGRTWTARMQIHADGPQKGKIYADYFLPDPTPEDPTRKKRRREYLGKNRSAAARKFAKVVRAIPEEIEIYLLSRKTSKVRGTLAGWRMWYAQDYLKRIEKAAHFRSKQNESLTRFELHCKRHNAHYVSQLTEDVVQDFLEANPDHAPAVRSALLAGYVEGLVSRELADATANLPLVTAGVEGFLEEVRRRFPLYGPYFTFLAYSGWSPTEVSSLAKSDLHLDAAKPSADRWIATEGRMRREPLPPECVEAARIALSLSAGDLVFVNALGRAVGQHTVQRICREIDERIHPKTFQVQFALRMVERGATLNEIQKALGHERRYSTSRMLANAALN